MTPEAAIQLVRSALMMAMWVSAPLLIVAFIVGIVINLIQVVTSLQDSAFSTIPRLAAFLVALLLALPWMTSKMMAYTTTLLGDLSKHAR